MQTLVQRLQHWVGLDRAIVFNLTGRVWSLLSGAVTMFLIGTRLTESELGLYWNFFSILGLQVFLELGLGQCLVQFASHEFARLRFRADGVLEGERAARDRLLTMARLAVNWYVALAGLLVVLVGGLGQWFLARHATGSEVWVGPWWALIVVAACNLAVQPVWFMLEGCNQVVFVNGYRTLAQMATGLAMWTTILLGGKLAANAAGVVAALLAGGGLLVFYRRPFLRQVLGHSARGGLGLLREIWPFQWRMALSFASGYLVFSLFTPAVTAASGLDVAGQMGMTWQLASALGMAASAWVSTKAPRYGILVSQRRFAELDALARRVLVQVVSLGLVGGLVLVAGVAWLKAHFAFGRHFLDPLSVALLATGTVSNLVIVCQAFYLRAHKQEPFVWLAVANGVLVAVGVLVLSSAYGPRGACLAYAVVQTGLLPFSTIIFRSCRDRWHA